MTFLGISDYWAFVVAIVVFLAVPGPGNLAVMTSTAKGGLRGGLASAFGIMAGDQVLIWTAVAGAAALLAAYPNVFAVVRYAGAAYLFWLGVQLLRARPGDAPVLKMKPSGFFRQSFLITLMNPKAIVFYMAFFPLFVNPATHRGLLTFAAMAVTIALLTFAYCATLALLTQRIGERVRANARASSWLSRIAGTALVGFGLKLVVSR